MNAKKLFLFFSYIIFSTHLSHPMLLKSLSQISMHTKKYINQRTIQDAFKKKVAQEFFFEPKISDSSTIILHHNEKEQFMAFCKGGTSLLIFALTITENIPVQYVLPIATLSLLSLTKNTRNFYKRERIINQLKKENLSNLNKHTIQTITQNDILKNINKLLIIPSKQPSYIECDKKNISEWNINNIQVLEDILKEEYNSTDYTLHWKSKE